MLPRRLLLVLILTLPAGTVRAADFRTEFLDVGEATVRAVRTADLTGDGAPEVVAFADDPGGICVAVWQAGEKGFPRKPTSRLRPADRGLSQVYFTCLAVLEKGGPAEIVTVDRTGVFAHRLVRPEKEKEDDPPPPLRFGKPRRIGDAPPLPFFPDESRITVLDAAADLDRDGVDELLLPSAEGYRILRVGTTRGGVVDTGLGHRLEVRSHRHFTLHWSIPRLTVADWDADGIPDLVAGFEGEFLLYLQRKDGTFFSAPRPLSVLEPGPEELERTLLTLADVNADGRIDLLLTQSPSSVKVMERFTTQHALFLNPRIFSTRTKGSLATPAVTFKTEGFAVNPTLTDFDGDGDLDLLVTSLEMDISSRILKEITAEYMLFRFEGRKFERKPWFKVDRQFPLDQLEQRSTEPVCFFGGDFDGDGERDLLDIADNGHLTIVKGTSDTGFLSTDPYAFKEELYKRKMSVDNDVRIVDLDRDGTSDVVAYRDNLVFVIRSLR